MRDPMKWLLGYIIVAALASAFLLGAYLGTRTPLVGAQDRCSALCEQNKGGVWTSWDGRTQCVCAPLPQGGAR